MNAQDIKPRIGSIVEVERAALLSDAVIERCRALLEVRGVLVFPKLNLTDDEQLAFTDKCGTRINFVTRTNPAGGNPDVYKITLDPKLNPQPEYVQGTFFWHMDGLNSPIEPPKASLLSARSVAAKGGQTEFANTYAAYDSLPADEKAEIAGLRVRHSLAASLRPVVESPTTEDFKLWTESPGNEHPLVWNHRSGRKSLVVGTTADKVVGMPVPDGRSLLARLLEWTAQPDFYYRHQWQVGDFVIWDNCGTLHRVIPYDRDSGRLMHRTSIAGTESVN